jgi:GH18 family chitinase
MKMRFLKIKSILSMIAVLVLIQLFVVSCDGHYNPQFDAPGANDNQGAQEDDGVDGDVENEGGGLPHNSGSESTEFLRFGYLDVPNVDWNWANYEQLFDGSYTHLILSAMLPTSNGSMVPVDSMIDFSQTFIEEAQNNNTYVLFSIGASVVPYATYISIANDPTARETFINGILSVLQMRGFDGVDLNFEGWFDGMSEQDIAAGNGLASDIAEAVKGLDESYIVTVTLPASYFIPYSFKCAFINSELIDYAHHMSYDFFWGTDTGANGPWRAQGETIWLPGESQPIERSVYGSLSYLQGKGCNMEKISAGIPFFSTRIETWNETRDLLDWKNVSLHPDYLEKLVATEIPYHWVNDAESVSAKIEAYREFGLGGVMVWQVGQEGSTGDLSEALFNASTE